MSMLRGLRAVLRGPNVNTDIIPFRATVSGGVVSQANHQGGESLTIGRTSQGIYTLTLKNPCKRLPLLLGSIVVESTGNYRAVVLAAPTTSVITFSILDTSNAVQDPSVGFHGAILVCDALGLVK